MISDTIGALARAGRLGPILAGPATGYTSVYLIEVALLFATLIAVGPLVRRRVADPGLSRPHLSASTLTTPQLSRLAGSSQ
jgi:BCD family chlorophyll transporter-like MFS transporter